ncbi:uncharacterized protein LOC144651180 isoform X2 [Oculina patagonica]
MRLFEIQFLLAFCLVFAEGFVMDMYIPTGTTGDEVAVENLDDGTDFDAEKASMEDTPKDEVRRQLRPTRPPIIRPVHIPLYVPGNMDGTFFRICYCFWRLCYVPGMRQGFLGWHIRYQSGYVVIGNWLYKFL